MDPIVIYKRTDNDPPASAPGPGEISAEQYDASLENLKTGIEQAYDETVKIADAVDLTPLPSALAGTDTIVVLRGTTPHEVSLADLAAFLVADPVETAPAAFSAGQWTATAGVEQIELNITALPANGGSAITALQYRLDGGSPVALAGTGTGVRAIAGLTGATEYDVQIRAVNAIGAGAWSDTKSRTPTAAAGGGDPDFIGATYTAGNGTINATRPAGAGAGHYLTAIVFSTVYGSGPTGSAAVAGTPAPSGWAAGTGLVAGANPAGTDGQAARMLTAPGDVATTTFDQANMRGVLLIATRAPLRAGSAFVGWDGGNSPGPDAPTPSIAATAGDLVVSAYIQVDAGAGGVMTGAPTSGYTRELDKNDAEPYVSVVAQEGHPGGATGAVSHGANGNYSSRFGFTGAYGA